MLKLKFTLFLLSALLYEMHRGAADPLINEIESRVKENCGKTQIKIDDNACGGVLQAEDKPLTLSYKMETPKDHYESCVWTIESVKNPVIKINVTSPLFKGSPDFLSIGYFTNYNYDFNSLQWNQVAMSTKTQFLEVPAPVAFVHYSATFGYPIFGFRLNYKAGEKQANPNNYFLKNYFLQGAHGVFSYPPEDLDTQLLSNHRVSVVIKGYPGISAGRKPNPSYIHLLGKKSEGSANCAEYSLNMLAYGPGQKKWFKNSTICGPSYSEANLNFNPRNDPVIITFQSGSGNQGNEFEIRWQDLHF